MGSGAPPLPGGAGAGHQPVQCGGGCGGGRGGGGAGGGKGTGRQPSAGPHGEFKLLKP